MTAKIEGICENMKNLKDWNIVVVGAGNMGSCIAGYFAEQGHKTAVYDISKDCLENAKQQIENNLDALIQYSGLTESEKKHILGRLRFSENLEETLKNADIVFEAAPEVAELKKELFEKLHKYAPEHAYLCSNTSGLNIYEFLDIKDPKRVIIAHFFNPAHLMPLVEIVKGENTPQETAEIIRGFMLQAKKKPVIINKPVPGFVFNRIIMALEVEAFHLVESGVVTFQEIDDIITSTLGARFTFEGLFGLIDHCGLDTEVRILEYLIPQLWKGNDVPKMLLDRVKRGDLGLKTGKGFGDFTGQNADELRRKRATNILKTIEFQKTLK
jgi:3-hydroxybutyryl-CoA dehydrogenase